MQILAYTKYNQWEYIDVPDEDLELLYQEWNQRSIEEFNNEETNKKTD